MRTLWFACRQSLLWALPATALALAVLWIGVATTGTGTPWLHVAAFLPVVASSLSAVAFWPPFATDARGAELVRRTTKGPLHGMPTATLGALLAAAACLLLLAVAASPLVPEPRAHHRLRAHERPLLDDGRIELSFALPEDCVELQLRPVVLMPRAAPEATSLQIAIDGKELAAGPVMIFGDRQLVRVPLERGSGTTVALRRISGNLPLWFDAAAVLAVDDSGPPRLLGCALAFSVWLLPLWVTLGTAMLLSRWLRQPMALVVAGVALVLQSLGQVGPATAAVTLCARGHWLLTEPIFWPCITSLGAGVAAMIAAMALRAEHRR
jgi:hypothetical protein